MEVLAQCGEFHWFDPRSTGFNRYFRSHERGRSPLAEVFYDLVHHQQVLIDGKSISVFRSVQE